LGNAKTIPGSTAENISENTVYLIYGSVCYLAQVLNLKTVPMLAAILLRIIRKI
jgi:hypothetical protein